MKKVNVNRMRKDKDKNRSGERIRERDGKDEVKSRKGG